MQENKNPCLMKEQWLDKYLYIEICKIFFNTLLIELYEWIAKFVDVQGRWRLDNPIVWTSELVQRMEASEDKLTHVVNHSLDRVIGRFVTEFAVDTLVSYNEVERHFFKGLRGKYLRSLNTWINILLCENQVMPLP